MFTRSALLGVAGAALLALGGTPALASSWGFSFGIGSGYYAPAPVVTYYDYPAVVYPYAPRVVYYSAPARVYCGGYYGSYYHYRPVYRSYGYYSRCAPRHYGGHSYGGGFYYRGGHHH